MVVELNGVPVVELKGVPVVELKGVPFVELNGVPVMTHFSQSQCFIKKKIENLKMKED